MTATLPRGSSTCRLSILIDWEQGATARIRDYCYARYIMADTNTAIPESEPERRNPDPMPNALAAT